MPIITIETNKLDTNSFQLIRTVSIGYANLLEFDEIISAPDRMVAAMTNLGLACRWFIDRNAKDATRQVWLQRDFVNPDEIENREHNDLFSAVRNLHNHLYGNIYQYRQDRLKYQAFYGDYVKYLDRIIDYLIRYKITVKLTDYKENFYNENTNQTNNVYS